jgi:hypothetical protein
LQAVLSFFWTATALILCALIGIDFGVYCPWKAAISTSSKPSSTTKHRENSPLVSFVPHALSSSKAANPLQAG